MISDRNLIAEIQLQYETVADYIRLGSEIGVVLGALAYLFAACNEARFLGRRMFLENMVNLNNNI